MKKKSVAVGLAMVMMASVIFFRMWKCRERQ